VRLKDDERGHQKPVAVIDVQQQNDDDIQSTNQGYASGVAQCQRLGLKVCAQLFKDARSIPPLAQFGEAGVNVAKLADGMAGRGWDGGTCLDSERGAETELCCAFYRRFKQGSGLSNLGEQEAGCGIGLVETGFKGGRQLLHFETLDLGQGGGLTFTDQFGRD